MKKENNIPTSQHLSNMNFITTTKFKKCLIALAALSILMLLSVTLHYGHAGKYIENKKYNSHTNSSNEQNINKEQKAALFYYNSTVHYLIVICKGINKLETSHQINRTRVLIKSAAALTRVVIRFTIFSESEQHYQDVISHVKLWAQVYQHRLQLEFQPIKYPLHSEALRNMAMKPCATYLLLLPDLLQNVDSAVYIDTDMIFLQPPEDIWKEFGKFEKKEAAAVSEDCCYSFAKVSYPFPGKNGLNSGVLLMNLTRLRSAPDGGFTQSTLKIYQQYKKKLKLADQGIINIYFARNRNLLRVLGCEWNYRPFYCRAGHKDCPEAMKNGASLVHGSAKAFRGNFFFRDLFKAWEEYEIGTSIQTLVMKIQDNLKNSKANGTCTAASNVTSAFTNKLYLYEH